MNPIAAFFIGVVITALLLFAVQDRQERKRALKSSADDYTERMTHQELLEFKRKGH